MTSLADLLDPDQWIVPGKSLLDFPGRKETMNERLRSSFFPRDRRFSTMSSDGLSG
jgi:hypothetical protein